MLLKANISTSYLWRLGLIAMFCIGVSLWFLYDGTITYPRQRERALTYQELGEENQLDQWKKIATDRGWPLEYPGKPKTEVDIHFQLVLAALSAPPGLLCLFFFLRSRGRWIEFSGTGLRTSWRQQLEFSQIATLDKKKWKSKGIVRINYRQNGRKRRLVLDDWKYDTDATKAILLEVEARIDVHQIVGGAPEPRFQEEHEEVDSATDREAT